MLKYIIIASILLLPTLLLKAQEVLVPLDQNPVVNQLYLQQKLLKSKQTPSAETLVLPFYDDFSAKRSLPDANKWIDKFTFINTDYALNPPSIGVATLDALDESGKIYSNGGPNPFDADYLTSAPIRLDSIFYPEIKKLRPSDSVFLSFYYQPQGRSISPPSKNASLSLEFHTPSAADTNGLVWKEVWKTSGGEQIDSFAVHNGQYFKRVNIPITDTSMFRNGFNFRFHNIATLSGNSQPDWRNNGSHWNIDIVYLNYKRSINDTTLYDIAFGNPAPSMLHSYQAMPYKQYISNFVSEMKTSLEIDIANLDKESHNINYQYTVSRNNEAPYALYNAGAYNIEPFSSHGYLDYAPFAEPPVNTLFQISNDKEAVFHIEHTISPVTFPGSNDTIRFDQVFSNYYAYDNGTAEAGIGINGASGSYAVQFKLNVADTLQGIQMYFNTVLTGINLQPFNLVVWKDQFGHPAQAVRTISGVYPDTNQLNQFTTYWFDEPLIINAATFPGLIFYIGWTQDFLENLNVGFDRYTDSHDKRFYNVTGTWQKSDSLNYGSVMMRPIIAGVKPMTIPETTLQSNTASIYPNPVTGNTFNIRLPQTWDQNEKNDLIIQIFGADGKLVAQKSFTETFNTDNLAPGLYLMRITNKTGLVKTNVRFIKR